MDKLLAALEKKEATKILDYYKDYDINNLGKKDNKDELLERYPILETEPIYALRDTTKDNMKGKLEEYFEKAGYTTEDWERDKLLDTSVSVSAKSASQQVSVQSTSARFFTQRLRMNLLQ